MFGRILSVALLLSTFTGSSQAFALSDCPVDVECGTSPITMLAALPLSGLSVLAGTFVVPALVKSDTEEGPGYLSLWLPTCSSNYRWSHGTGGSDGGFGSGDINFTWQPMPYCR